MSEEQGLSNFLQVLNSWKNSEGVMVFVRWSSGTGDVTFSCRARVFDADKEEIHFMADEDKGNASMTVSLAKSRVALMEKGSIVLVWDDSGAKLSMSAKLQ
jgi:hypothetical protein